MKDITKITGWFEQGDMDTIRPYVQSLPEKSLLVEIGTFHGKSSLFFRLLNPNIYILTNDICNQDGIGTQPNQVNIGTIIPSRIDEEVLEEGNIFQVRGSSHEVVKTFNWPIDFLFIDSEHSYKDTLDTLNEWGKFVKSDHFIACHDYSTDFPGVIQAVKEYAERPNASIVTVSSQMAILKV